MTPAAVLTAPSAPAVAPATPAPTTEIVACEACAAPTPEGEIAATDCLDWLLLCNDCTAHHYGACRTCATAD